MIHITVALPDEVAQHYYTASQRLADSLEAGVAPNPQTLMGLMLAGFTAPEIESHFARALCIVHGAPMPDESHTWVFSPEFENAP